MADKKVYNVTDDSIEILNTIRTFASAEYKAAVPIVTKDIDTLRRAGQALSQYTAIQNEFVNALINRIGLTMVKNLMFTNPLKRFKKGVLAVGETIEEIFIELAKMYDYSWEIDGGVEKEDNPFKREIPDVKAFFHQLNSQKVFKTTFTEAELGLAFTSFAGVGDFVKKVIQSVYNAYEVYEWETTKALLGDAYAAGAVKKIQVADTDTTEGLSALVKKTREISSKMTMPSKDYTAAGVTNVTKRNDQYIFINAELEAALDVDVLSKAFNMDRTTFLGHVIVLDYFPEGMESVKAMIVDKDWFMIYDKLLRTETTYNAAMMYFNMFMHVWQVYSYSKVENAVAFTTEEVA